MAENQYDIEKIKEKFNAYYNTNTLPVCTSCKTNDRVIPCVAGRPTKELALYAEAGFAELQGCVVQPGSPVAKCKKCDLYIHRDEEK